MLSVVFTIAMAVVVMVVELILGVLSIAEAVSTAGAVVGVVFVIIAPGIGTKLVVTEMVNCVAIAALVTGAVTLSLIVEVVVLILSVL